MSVRMSAQNARQALVIGWFACFLISLAILLSLYFGEWIYPDNFRSALTQLSSLYAPYLGAILAFYFSSRTQPSRAGAAAGTPFVLAVLGSVIWNLTILIVLAVLMLIGAIPAWPHSRNWGYGPSGGLGLVLLIVVILLLTGRL